MCRYSRWLPSDSAPDSWPRSPSLLGLERAFFLRTEPRARRSRQARIMWARSCWSRWKFSLRETGLNTSSCQLYPSFRDASRWRNLSRRGRRWQFVVLSVLTRQPVGCLCAFALKKRTFTVVCSHRMYLMQGSPLYLQIGFPPDLILKLAVGPLQDVYSRLTHMDPQGCRL